MGSSPKAGRRPRLHPSRQSPAASASQLAGRQTKRRGGAHTGAKRLPARSHPPFYRQSMLLLGLRRAAASAPKPRDKGGRHAPAHHPIVRPGERAAPEAAPARRRGDRPAPFASPLSLTKPADALSSSVGRSVGWFARPTSRVCREGWNPTASPRHLATHPAMTIPNARWLACPSPIVLALLPPAFTCFPPSEGEGGILPSLYLLNQ